MNLGTIWSNKNSYNRSNRIINNNKPKRTPPRPPPPPPTLNVNNKSTRSFWGKATWYFFHVIASRINDNYYRTNCEYIWGFIKKICFNLPCPHCKTHATNYVKNINISQVNTRGKLERFLFDFHNSVNSRTGKQQESISTLNKYKNSNIKAIFDLFEERFFHSYIGRRQFDDWIKNEIRAEYYNFFNNVRTHFV